MAGEHILIVEDEADIAELVEYNLARADYDPQCVATGEEGLVQAREAEPDLVILDLMLPGLSGLEVCRRLKADPRTARIPVIMLTAKGEEEDIVAGFEAGADDYVTKPFRPKVLLARVRAVLRRGTGQRRREDDVVDLEGLEIHPGRHEVRVDGEVVDLTRTEFRILQFLASRPGWVFTRSQIVRSVHGDDYPVTGRSVDVQVAALRRKLGAAGPLIQTVRGVGYKMGD
ncbi:MAG: response regulator transcription factor [Krumholzibacteria bacterium]|nr:response regulator transcription factor [Candidatus Krumholzibacteria bacterium]